MNRTPRAAVIQDISGFGRCSMTVTLPVLSVLGVQCCPLLTASLSAHTAFPLSDKSVMLDLSGRMEDTADHWAQLGVTFDAIYSGFLASQEQIGIIERFYERFRTPDTLVLVDPVMGDHGRPYRTCTPALCTAMGELAAQARLITPNLTEAALLLGEDYANVPQTEEEARVWLERLSLDGRRSVVLTGLGFVEGQIGAGCLEAPSGKISFAMAQQAPAQFPGTGDLFASVLLGVLLRGETLAAANERSVAFVQRCAAYTVSLGTPVLEGVQFEPLLGELASLPQPEELPQAHALGLERRQIEQSAKPQA